jgi:hypothetical protein
MNDNNKVELFPTKPELNDAIRKLEENDEIYRMDSDFNGITITEVRVEKDDDGNCQIFYDAKVDYFSKSQTFYDCHVTMAEIKEFLPKHYSLK